MKTIKMPKQYWEDLTWARKHHTELLRKYRNQWVAIFGKKIISAGNNLGDVRKKAKLKSKKNIIPVMFVDGGEHIYGF